MALSNATPCQNRHMTVRVALANLPYPDSPANSVEQVIAAIHEAARHQALLVCFPEAYVPGYRLPGQTVPPPDAAFLEAAFARIAQAAAEARIGVILGTERLTDAGLLLTALVISPAGEPLGFQDKVQLDPSEEPTYAAGAGRRIFTIGPLTFGIAICHEGWRYPETVRWAAQRGAQIVFHPQFHAAEPGSYQPTTYADPANSFHEKAVLCRAAENSCYFATVNYASPGSPTTSAIAGPEGQLIAYQPYGQSGLLVADLDLTLATGLLASRLKS